MHSGSRWLTGPSSRPGDSSGRRRDRAAGLHGGHAGADPGPATRHVSFSLRSGPPGCASVELGRETRGQRADRGIRGYAAHCESDRRDADECTGLVRWRARLPALRRGRATRSYPAGQA